MICKKMAMKHGKVQKYDLEVVEKYDGKEGIFKAQQVPIDIASCTPLGSTSLEREISCKVIFCFCFTIASGTSFEP